MIVFNSIRIYLARANDIPRDIENAVCALKPNSCESTEPY